MSARAAIGFALAALVAGCAALNQGTRPPAPSESGQPAPSGFAGDCQPLDLRLPSGEQLDLTGSWLGDDLGPYQLHQFGDCLWWVGQNRYFTYVLFGRIQPDFTIDGRWSIIAASGVPGEVVAGPEIPADFYGTGGISLQIVIAADGRNDTLRLTKVFESDVSYDNPYQPNYPINVSAWSRVDDDPDHPIPTAAP